MAKINILPAKVYNRIAAGEVVDRPYSVVKELVENAIDAGATQIEIYVENGGKDLIRVVDNGCGIEREDLQSAFLPHATSKIARAEDLENIMTLGFRGEAVASIASVSRMTITSQVEGGKCYRLTSDGGELGTIVEATGGKGTDVQVEMLFFNAPVRLKFLKSDRAEEADITTYVSRFILNRADVAFTYYVNGKKVLQSFGEGEEEALVCVYGANTRAQCIQIDGERHGVRVRGFIGNQNFYKSNKSYQSVFLNGRFVLNSTIATAVSGAYANYLMKRQYPFYVLHITVPTEIVDVNVHPNKADVRFADNKIIYGCIYKIISDVLDGNSKALEYVVSNNTEVVEEETIKPQIPPQKSLSESILEQAKNQVQEEMRKEEGQAVFDIPSSKDMFGFPVLTYEEAQKEIEACTPLFEAQQRRKMGYVPNPDEKPRKGVTPLDQIGELDESKLVYAADGERVGKRRAQNPEKLLKRFPGLVYQPNEVELHDSAYPAQSQPQEDYFAENKRFLEELERKSAQRKVDVDMCVYVGKAFNTYLIYEYNDKLLLIDQHAAHERLIFDKLKEKMRMRNVVRQPMLLPYTLTVNAIEALFLRERLSDICDIGFDMQETQTNTFEVTSIPADIATIKLDDFFKQILGDIDGYKAIKLEEVLKDKLATAACKAAIKGGMDISQAEITELLRQMDGDMGLKCPHGRPVVVELSKTEIEKMFKRII